jgi:low affinity Fe/Cu permease
MGPDSLEKSFATFAAMISKWAGSSTIFALASISILAWAACGPFFVYSAEWQMIVNTGTTHLHLSHGVHHSEQPES